ncbi:hypothetical protein FQN60_009801, partial [Etheostoma spectabile]
TDIGSVEAAVDAAVNSQYLEHLKTPTELKLNRLDLWSDSALSGDLDGPINEQETAVDEERRSERPAELTQGRVVLRSN